MKKSKKIIITIISIVMVCIISAGSYLANMFGLLASGNSSKYSVSNTPVDTNRPLSDKTILFLGSSVTYGYGSKGESFADFLEKQDSLNAIKEAVSGTTLVDNGKRSYVSRLKSIDTSINADMLICQLSTNDATKNMPLGKISDTYDKNSFDTSTIAGAIEYIIAYSADTFGCPVVFYTGTYYESENYKAMVNLLYQIKEKWNIGIIDFYNDEEMNSISEEEYTLYMTDKIHPSRAGYKLWWTPKFREYLISYEWE